MVLGPRLGTKEALKAKEFLAMPNKHRGELLESIHMLIGKGEEVNLQACKSTSSCGSDCICYYPSY